MSVPHAEVLFLHEVLSVTDPVGRYIRTTGVVESFDAPSSCCIISHKGETFPIDAELIRSEISVGSTYQVFGEVQHAGEKVIPGCGMDKFILKARIFRNVDGIDMLLFEKTVQQTRKFVQENFLSA